MKKIAIAIVAWALTLTAFGQFKILETKLNPLSPPADNIMKTIDQVEPRVAITKLNTPPRGGLYSESFLIEDPGSYYLTENLYGATGEDGIVIVASDVHLDLNGFGLIGSTNTSPHNAPGIVVETNTQSVVIENGTISLWHKGIVGKGTNLVVRNVHCNRNEVHGLEAGRGTYVLDSTFSVNKNHGVLVGEGAVVRGVQVYTNDMGIVVGEGSLVKDCTAYRQTNHGITLDGDGSRAESCVAYLNNNGIEIKGDRCTVVNCTSVDNRSEGIQCGSFVGSAPTACRIEGNHVVGNANSGIFVNGTNNLIVCNMAQGGNYPYFIFASNMVGEVVSGIDAVGVSGATGGNLGAGISPWANFAR